MAMTITAVADPSTASVKITVLGGTPGAPLYVLRRGGATGTGMVRETSEGTVVWPAAGTPLVLTDYEATQGVNTMYILTDGDGSPVASTSVPVPLWGTWLKSPGRPFRNTRVRYQTDTAVKLAARRLVIDVEGSPQRVVFAQNRSNPTGTVTLVTLTRAEANALRLLVSDGMTLLLDTPPSWDVPFRYMSVGDVAPERAFDFDGLGLTSEARAWVLADVVEVEMPQGVPVLDPGRTYADLPVLFSTYVAIPATTDTYEKLGTGEE